MAAPAGLNGFHAEEEEELEEEPLPSCAAGAALAATTCSVIVLSKYSLATELSGETVK